MNDMCSYSGETSSQSSPTDICNTDSETYSDTDHLQANPAKKLCTMSSSQQGHFNLTHCLVNRVTTRNGRNNSLGQSTVMIIKKHFVKFAKTQNITRENWRSLDNQNFNNLKKPLEKMQVFSQTHGHTQSYAAEVDAATAFKGYLLLN